VELIDIGPSGWLVRKGPPPSRTAFWTIPIVGSSWRTEKWTRDVSAGMEQWVELRAYPSPYEEQLGY
jgi:hypothetical protein